MKIIDVAQGSPQWVLARRSRPTASNFNKIISTSGNPSKQADRYLARLAVEWFLNVSLDDFQSDFMERGKDLEPLAVREYEFVNGVQATAVGLCTLDDGSAGASPDRLIGDKGLLEVKCPSAEVQMMYVIGGPPDDYFVQVQGQLWVCEREWCDLYCWSNKLPTVTRRYVRDDKFIKLLAAEVGKLTARLAAVKEKYAAEKNALDAEAEAAAGGVPPEIS